MTQFDFILHNFTPTFKNKILENSKPPICRIIIFTVLVPKKNTGSILHVNLKIKFGHPQNPIYPHFPSRLFCKEASQSHWTVSVVWTRQVI